MSLQVRFLDYNYVFQSNVTLTASTADTEFPVSNLQNQIRSKLWRSNLAGQFIIVTGTNDTIDFNKGGGALVATIAAGTYTSTTLATTIAAALNAADGVNTYTVTYSQSTGLWTIATSGATLNLLWNSGANKAKSIGPAIGFGNTVDSTGAITYTGSTIAIHTEESITIDLQSPTAIDSFAWVFDAMRGNPFSSNVVLTLMANATNIWSSPAVSQSLTIDTTYDSVSNFFTSNQTYRYWRLKIVDPANTNLQVEVAKLGLALATQLSSLPIQGFTYDLLDQSQIYRNLYGHEYTDLYPTRKNLAISYMGLSYADWKTIESIYRRNGMITPFFMAMDPTQVFFNKDNMLFYCKFDQGMAPVQNTRDVFNNQINFKEVF